MAWVKKNLFILIAGLISLAVLGYAVFFVLQKKTADEEVTASLDEAAQKYKDLLARKMHPGSPEPGKTNNIEIAKAELGKVRSFMEEMREFLKGAQTATNLNNQIFRAQLDTSISELRRQAEQAGVALPNTNFWFTFTSYKTTVDFKGDVAGLAAELADLKEILRIVYDARVHSVVQVQRAAVSDTEFMGTSDYIGGGKTPRTNDWAITTPYSVTFQGFSSELARVMEGLANAKQCFVVKSIGVAQAPEERKPTPAPNFMQPMPVNPMMNRYNMRPQMNFIPPPPAGGARPQQTPKYILDENKLRFTLQLDSVRLKPREK